MNVDTLGKWMTLGTASVAAVAGVWNLAIQMRGKRDRFIVGMGSVEPSIEQETMMHVISCSDHPIRLKDTGFIKPDGSLESLRMAWETGDAHEHEMRGSSELSGRNSTYEVGYIRHDRLVGAYAISVTQRRPRIGFALGTPYLLRLRVRARLLWRGENYLA